MWCMCDTMCNYEQSCFQSCANLSLSFVLGLFESRVGGYVMINNFGFAIVLFKKNKNNNKKPCKVSNTFHKETMEEGSHYSRKSYYINRPPKRHFVCLNDFCGLSSNWCWLGVCVFFWLVIIGEDVVIHENPPNINMKRGCQLQNKDFKIIVLFLKENLSTVKHPLFDQSSRQWIIV